MMQSQEENESKRALLYKITYSKSQKVINGLDCMKGEDYQALVDLVKETPEIVNIRGGQRKGTLLHRCARNNRPRMVKFLLDNGAEQKLDIHCNYPLHYACIREVIKKLEFKNIQILYQDPLCGFGCKRFGFLF